jgi:hypothetical protein
MLGAGSMGLAFFGNRSVYIVVFIMHNKIVAIQYRSESAYICKCYWQTWCESVS